MSLLRGVIFCFVSLYSKMSIHGELLIGQHLRQLEKGEIQLFQNWGKYDKIPFI